MQNCSICTIQFAVHCICGAEMTIAHTRRVNANKNSYCDGCEKRMGPNEHSFHCPKRIILSIHPKCYDFCFACGVIEFRKQKSDNECIVCQDRGKAVCFVDGCGHVVLCAECENGLESKVCPVCSTAYTHAKVLNL